MTLAVHSPSFSGKPDVVAQELDVVDRFLTPMGETAKLGVTKAWVSNRVEDPPVRADEVCTQTVARLAEPS